MDNKKNKKTSRILYVIYILLGVVVSIYLSLIGENMLNSILPNLGFIAPIIVISIWGWLGIWLLTGRITSWSIFRMPIIRLLIRLFVIVLATAIIWLAMPLYIDYLPQQGKMEFEQPYYDSTQVLVRYGIRENDFFWTEKTIGELKEKSSVALNVNGQDIFRIHTDGRQIFVDAILFAGYEDRIVANYTTIGSLDKFSIEMSGYFNTDAVGYPKYLNRKNPPSIIKNKALAQPVTIVNNAFDRDIGWKIRRRSTAFEVYDKNNIPVLILEYTSPYNITIWGLFLTPMGILMVS